MTRPPTASRLVLATRKPGNVTDQTTRARVVLLPGDGIGPEVAAEARLVLEALAPEVELDERLIGGVAIRAMGSPLPQDTVDACLSAVAVLKGPVGDPEFDAADVRPEQGLLALRAALVI